jgi:hypothetical protein
MSDDFEKGIEDKLRQNNFMDRTEQTWKDWGNGEWSQEACLDHFTLHGPVKRIEALGHIREQLRTVDPSNIRDAADLTALRRNLDQRHQALLKVGR